MTTTVTDPQVIVPESIAAAAGIKQGSLLEWIPTDEEGVVKLRVSQDRAAVLKSLCGAGRKYLKPGQDPIAELIAERKREG